MGADTWSCLYWVSILFLGFFCNCCFVGECSGSFVAYQKTLLGSCQMYHFGFQGKCASRYWKVTLREQSDSGLRESTGWKNTRCSIRICLVLQKERWRIGDVKANVLLQCQWRDQEIESGGMHRSLQFTALLARKVCQLESMYRIQQYVRQMKFGEDL